MIVQLRNLRQDAAEVLRQVQASKDPVVITQRGRAAVIMVSVREYERAEYERQMLQALLKGEREIAAGQGYDLDDVLAEADAILGRGEP